MWVFHVELHGPLSHSHSPYSSSIDDWSLGESLLLGHCYLIYLDWLEWLCELIYFIVACFDCFQTTIFCLLLMKYDSAIKFMTWVVYYYILHPSHKLYLYVLLSLHVNLGFLFLIPTLAQLNWNLRVWLDRMGTDILSSFCVPSCFLFWAEWNEWRKGTIHFVLVLVLVRYFLRS